MVCNKRGEGRVKEANLESLGWLDKWSVTREGGGGGRLRSKCS